MSDSRAAMVAAIRALADFIETRTDLPVPTSVHAQHSLIQDSPDNEAVVRDAAQKLGVKPRIDADSAWMLLPIADRHPVSVQYTVHGFIREAGESRD